MSAVPAALPPHPRPLSVTSCRSSPAPSRAADPAAGEPGSRALVGALCVAELPAPEASGGKGTAGCRGSQVSRGDGECVGSWTLSRCTA